MKTELEINGHILVIKRNHWNGKLSYSLDGEDGVLQKVFSVQTQFVLKSELQYEIKLDDSIVNVLHKRPRLFPAFRDHTFTILLDGEVLRTVRGR